MQAEVAAQKAAYQKTKRERAVLVRIWKKNMLKIVMKQALKTREWVTLDPVEFLNNLRQEVTPDSLKVMERVFEKHDTSRDSSIVIEMKAEIDRMKAAMQENIDNVRHLLREIAKINQTLAGA